MNHWLDSLPDSPQGATLAGRMATLKHRLTWGDVCWTIYKNNGVFSEVENNTLIGIIDHPRVLSVFGVGVLSGFLRRNGKWHWDVHDGTDMFRAGDCDDEYQAMRAAESAVGLPVFPYDRSGPRDPTKRIKGRLVSYRLPEGA